MFNITAAGQSQTLSFNILLWTGIPAIRNMSTIFVHMYYKFGVSHSNANCNMCNLLRVFTCVCICGNCLILHVTFCYGHLLRFNNNKLATFVSFMCIDLVSMLTIRTTFPMFSVHDNSV